MEIYYTFVAIVVIFEHIPEFASSVNPFEAEVFLPFEYISPENKAEGGSIIPDVATDGGVTETEGIVGDGFSFSGSGAGSYIYLGDSRDSCFTSPGLCTDGYTFSVWVKFGTKQGDFLYYISNGGQTQSSHGISLSFHRGHTIKVHIKTMAKRWRAQCTGDRLVWYHVALTWSETEGSRMFKDGVQCDEVAVGEDLVITSTPENGFYFGRSNKASTEATRGEGVLDEFLFWPERKSNEFLQNVYSTYLREPEFGKKHLEPGQLKLKRQRGKRIKSGMGQTRSDTSLWKCAKLCFYRDVFCQLAGWDPVTLTCTLSNVLVTDALEEDAGGAFVLEIINN